MSLLMVYLLPLIGTNIGVPNEFVRVRVEPAVAVLDEVKPVKLKPAPLRPVRVKLAALVPAP